MVVRKTDRAPLLLSLQAAEGGQTMTMVRNKCHEETQGDKGRDGEQGGQMCLPHPQEAASVITLLLGTQSQAGGMWWDLASKPSLSMRIQVWWRQAF